MSHPKLAVDYAGSPDFANRDHYSYGAGRRICPGMHLAERTMWRALAKLLWLFEIRPELDEEGNEKKLDVNGMYKDGLVHSPEEYEVRFLLRDQKRVAVVKREFEKAKMILAGWE